MVRQPPPHPSKHRELLSSRVERKTSPQQQASSSLQSSAFSSSASSPREIRIKRKDPPGVRVTDGTFLFSPLLGPQRHSTAAQWIGTHCREENPPQRGGSVVGRLLHIALCRETQSKWANNGRGTQRKALQECRHHHGHHSHRWSQKKRLRVCARVCMCVCRERERHRSLLSVRARDLPPPLFSSSESKQQQQQK